MALIYSEESYAINGAAMEVITNWDMDSWSRFIKRLWKKNFC